MAPPTLRLVLKQVYGMRQLWSIARHIAFNEQELSILTLSNIKIHDSLTDNVSKRRSRLCGFYWREITRRLISSSDQKHDWAVHSRQQRPSWMTFRTCLSEETHQWHAFGSLHLIMAAQIQPTPRNV
ncbi:hypothetical protein FOTG_05346 [Fusarium oxysporum f. sp. vasinfectum 25433]|uniref:Uncharacterized protein n=1 Tax=Fusarium oxysporum f. sp. vasinfectum 25433 TaxID=1089449 RepID=X0LSZ7_FUSOX|nr:hypothetical protein FOTG_05346 [Fusarium oxysporum f. sp. vasinfectum 25433]